MREDYKFILINERISIMEVSELLIKHGIKNKIVKAPVSIVNSCRFAIVINKKDVMLCKRVIGENITSII